MLINSIDNTHKHNTDHPGAHLVNQMIQVKVHIINADRMKYRTVQQRNEPRHRTATGCNCDMTSVRRRSNAFRSTHIIHIQESALDQSNTNNMSHFNRYAIKYEKSRTLRMWQMQSVVALKWLKMQRDIFREISRKFQNWFLLFTVKFYSPSVHGNLE